MEFKAFEIAAFLKGEVEGNGNVVVNNVSKIEEGKAGTLAFLANPKYESHIYTTGASVILVNKTFMPKQALPATLIRVDDAYQAFASLLDLYLRAKAGLKTGIEQPNYIDQSVKKGEDIYIGAFAYIGRNVRIGNGVKIYPQVYLGENVVIGDGSVLYAGVKVYDDCIIGSGCVLHSGVVIGSDGFGFAPCEDGTYRKIAQIGNVVVGDDVEIGANTTVDCGTLGSTFIRNGVKLDNLIQIAHNVEIGDNTVIAAQTGFAGSTKVGRNCKIAGQVGVVGHISIGDNVQIGAQTGVSKSIGDNETVLGSPAMEIKHSLKVYTIYRNLPQLREEVIRLGKEIKSLK
jgi:UDP-3-O-[3-hydroxymyristoyl] glucosamine N-acyltransferase